MILSLCSKVQAGVLRLCAILPGRVVAQPTSELACQVYMRVRFESAAEYWGAGSAPGETADGLLLWCCLAHLPSARDGVVAGFWSCLAETPRPRTRREGKEKEEVMHVGVWGRTRDRPPVVPSESVVERRWVNVHYQLF